MVPALGISRRNTNAAATVLACYDSPEHKAAEAIRNKHSTGDVIMMEGCDG